MADILEDILFSRKQSVQESKNRVSLNELDRMAQTAPLPINFFQSIVQNDQLTVIAEIKKKSPSAGLLRGMYDVSEIAMAYERGGASAISVLTEPDRFGGDITDIRKVRSSSKLPILRKDFIFDPYQIVEARAYGADAVLLISEMLTPGQLLELADCARTYLLEPLVELFTSDSLAAALNSKARLIGINTRNLRTLEMVPENVLYLSKLIPRDRKIVAESGFKTPSDIEFIKNLRISSVLIGESLLKKNNLADAVSTLVNAGRRNT